MWVRSVLTMPGRNRCRLIEYLCVAMVITLNLVVPVKSWSHNWAPNSVISEVEPSSKQVFLGNDTAPAYFKLLMHEGDNIIVGARNLVHNISLVTLEEDKKWLLTWHPQSFDIDLCKNKLDATLQSKCENFIQVMWKMDGLYYVCGTNAFKPTCRKYMYTEADPPAQISEFEAKGEELGTGRCPYDPDLNSTALFADGKLFSATNADFQARDPLIMEGNGTLTVQHRIRTVQHNSNMLNDPHFVSSFEIEDHIYFFMRENAIENLNCGKATYSRVARVCKRDQGERFQSVWTSFFKARLVCSIPGDIPFNFDELQATSEFSRGNYAPSTDPSKRTRMFYGVFNTPENSIHGSAVCAYTYQDIVDVFQGQFQSQDSPAHSWMPVPLDRTPNPHPGICVNDSKGLSDETNSFIRKHPLMHAPILPAGGLPVLFQTPLKGRFSAITLDWQVRALDKKYYDVMFIGTTDGRVLKAINKGPSDQVESVVIEDIQVMAVDEPIRELKIYRKHPEEKLIIISRQNIVSIPLHRCHRQKTCGDCLALQDPYCAWLDNKCSSQTSRGLQNLATGEGSICPDGGKRDKPDQNARPTPPTTEKPPVLNPGACPVCKCDCNQSMATTNVKDKSKYSNNGTASDEPVSEGTDTVIALPTADKLPCGTASDEPVSEGTDTVIALPTADKLPCAPKYIPVRTDDQVYTASTLAIASVVSIVVSVLVGFLIGYRVSLCRNQTRNTEQMINFEQHFGSLRKNPRHSIEASHNFYSEPNQKQYKIQNVLVSNNISQKNPNLPNGSIETKTVSAKQASKTYL